VKILFMCHIQMIIDLDVLADFEGYAPLAAGH
jgi:hypothetical protein